MELLIAGTVIFLCITMIVCTVVMIYAIKQINPQVEIPVFRNPFNKEHDTISRDYGYNENVPLERFTPDFQKEIKVNYDVKDKFDAKDN